MYSGGQRERSVTSESVEIILEREMGGWGKEREG